MYAIDIRGDSVISHAMARLCRRSGFSDLDLVATQTTAPTPPALSLGANQTRILNVLCGGQDLASAALAPDREQVRLAKSRYLISELPLGQFYRERYGAPLLNIEYHKLFDLVKTEQAAAPDRKACLTIETEAEYAPDDDWQLRHTQLPPTHSIVNLTWLANHAVAWQFSTQSADHLYVLTPTKQPWREEEWHPVLWAQMQSSTPIEHMHLASPVREYWVEGDWVHIGHATLPCHPIRRETWFTGLEDAWVLSRMLENYEEAIDEGLDAYQQFRRPRAQRIARHNSTMHQQLFRDSPLKRVGRNIGIGLRARFLPELAMQQIDWLYGYDCIKGFH